MERPTLIPEDESEEPPVVQCIAETESVARDMKSVLSLAGIPVQSGYDSRVGFPVVSIPRLLHSQAHSVLTNSPRFMLKEVRGTWVFGFYDPKSSQEIRNHEVIQKEATELLRRGKSAIDELSQCVLRGSEIVASRAFGKLLDLGLSGRDAIVNLLILQLGEPGGSWMMSRLREGDLREGFAFSSSHMEAMRLLFLNKENTALRHAIAIAGHFKIRGLVPDLVSLLEDPDFAEDADDAMIAICGEDLGFDFDLPAETRAQIAGHRMQWWQRHKR